MGPTPPPVRHAFQKNIFCTIFSLLSPNFSLRGKNAIFRGCEQHRFDYCDEMESNLLTSHRFVKLFAARPTMTSGANKTCFHFDFRNFLSGQRRVWLCNAIVFRFDCVEKPVSYADNNDILCLSRDPNGTAQSNEVEIRSPRNFRTWASAAKTTAKIVIFFCSHN
jgi:hypothetical protein